MATSGFTLDDVTFSGSGPTVTTRQNLLINGQVMAESDSIATVIVTVSFNPPGSPAGLFEGCTGAPSVTGSNGGDCAAGFHFAIDLSNTNHAPIATPAFTVPTGVPIIEEWSIEADANNRAVGDFSSTMSFPTSGPVFDLPAGFTVDSSEGRIQDNQWLGVPVPEPGSSSLLAFGIACLAGGCARRRRSLAPARSS